QHRHDDAPDRRRRRLQQRRRHQPQLPEQRRHHRYSPEWRHLLRHRGLQPSGPAAAGRQQECHLLSATSPDPPQPTPTTQLPPASLTPPTTLALAGHPSTYTFDATGAFTSLCRSITIGTTTLQTGDAVVYDNGGGTSIGFTKSDGGTGTLKNGGTYYVIVDSSHPGRVQLAPSLADALSGNALLIQPVSGSSSMQSLSTGTVTIAAQSVSNPTEQLTLGS